jgi:hypothetical protein
MNRYAALGLVLDAMHERKQIIVLSSIASMIRGAMDEVIRSLDDADPDAYRVRRAKGNESIEFMSGGRIRFQGARTSLRGHSADVVFLDADADREIRDLRDLHAVIHPHGEIVRA